MPQAIERSLATPMTRPRLPAINGPGWAMSLLVMTLFQSWCARAAQAQLLSFLGLDKLGNPGNVRGRRKAAGGWARVTSRVASFQHQGRIGAAEAEAVRHDTVKVGHILPGAHDRDIGELGIELLDVGALADETVVHHEQGEDRLLYADGAQRVAGERFGGGYRRGRPSLAPPRCVPPPPGASRPAPAARR